MFSYIYFSVGTMIPKSGGDYAYIAEAFGPMPSFLYLWVALFILIPTANAITALTFAQNILQPLWLTCEPPGDAVKLIAAFITCKLYFFFNILIVLRYYFAEGTAAGRGETFFRIAACEAPKSMYDD